MHMWQLCHLAMVVPIADAYYEADCPERAGRDWKIMKKTARRLMRKLHKQFYAYMKRLKEARYEIL